MNLWYIYKPISSKILLQILLLCLFQDLVLNGHVKWD